MRCHGQQISLSSTGRSFLFVPWGNASTTGEIAKVLALRPVEVSCPELKEVAQRIREAREKNAAVILMMCGLT